MSEINAELQSLTPNALIELFILDTNVIGFATIDYFFAGTDANRLPIVFQGISYQPIPLEVTGFEFTGQGTTPKPAMKVSNSGGIISATALQYNDLVGAKVTRKRTFAKFLDNQPTADPTQELAQDVYYVNRKVAENAVEVQFELTTSFDLVGLQLPSRQVIQNSCPWIYKGAECTWVPVAGKYFDTTDTPQSLPGADQCGKRLTSCQLRFGNNVPIPFGGFPGATVYVNNS
jgi:lambda family phage minor tail protein L